MKEGDVVLKGLGQEIKFFGLKGIVLGATKNLYWVFLNFEVVFLMSYCISIFPAVKLKKY
jgi:hypothetical protein